MMKIRVFLAFSNNIFSESISRMLEGEKDIAIVGVLKPDATYDAKKIGAIGAKNPHVILADFTTLYNSFPATNGSFSGIHSQDKGPSFILVDTNCGSENIVSSLLKKKVSGILLGDADCELMKKAIRAVANGDVWIDKKTVKSILDGVNVLGSETVDTLTDREKEIVSLTGTGFRNKEIAHRLHVTESTIKTHLHNVFQKLGIKTRAELITYAIKNEEMSSKFVNRPAKTES